MPDSVVILKALIFGVVIVPPMEALPVIAKGALIVTLLVPVPDISIDGGAVLRFALRRSG